MNEQAEQTIILYGTMWCGDCRRSRRFLESKGIAYTYIDIETDDDAAVEVERINHGYKSVPTIVFPDGTVLVEPSNRELAGKLGIAA
jgi:mycoredoxin